MGPVGLPCATSIARVLPGPQCAGSQAATVMPAVPPTSSGATHLLRSHAHSGGWDLPHQKQLGEGASGLVRLSELRVWHGGGACTSVKLHNVFYTKACGSGYERSLQAELKQCLRAIRSAHSHQRRHVDSIGHPLPGLPPPTFPAATNARPPKPAAHAAC